ncbi:MAG: hypothetical protein RSE45_01805 [Bacilli bacterium]
MKNIFEGIGFTLLLVFSFYYTDKVVQIFNKEDALLVSINKYNDNKNYVKHEGRVTSDGVILGYCEKINKTKSYNNMIGKSFNKDLLIYDKDDCLITRENNYDSYIIKGNPYKNSVSIIIKVNNGEYLPSILSILKSYNKKVDLLINSSIYENNKSYYESINKSTTFVVNETIDNFKSLKKKFNNIVCIYSKDNNMLNICSKSNITTIKTESYYYKDILNNIKNNDKGDFIILEENEALINELNSIINYLNAKGINIAALNEHLS